MKIKRWLSTHISARPNIEKALVSRSLSAKSDCYLGDFYIFLDFTNEMGKITNGFVQD